MQAGIEFWVVPQRLQFRRADSVGVSRILEIDRITNGSDPPGPLVWFAITRLHHIKYLFETLTALRPAFDDLNAVEIS